ncbi:intracellular ribonuclease LX-like [Vicia villosa]|uniref:intracellular ribonuclease LX-like n=1 Tax=Vicia villosa TaxID=3911 RepID=UPI00273B04E8|nr:intracellular ribonuclease LX-like [Vicia villosa]XP_058774578.1 intracellular ribonuclease LX-like [Vicia villosa]
MALSSSRMSVVIIVICFTFSLNMCVGTDYDYLALAHQWQPGYCRMPDIKFTCQKKVTDNFSIHGLWPSKHSGPQPRDCTTDGRGGYLDVNKMIGSLISNLKKSWPSSIGKDEDLWTYQWRTHGTCYYDGNKHKQYKYFQTADNFYKNFELFNKLKAEGIVPVSGLGKNYTTEAAIKAIRKQYTQDTVTYIPQFMCSPFLPHELYEVILCLDHEGNHLINCTRPSTCGNLFLWKLEP